MPKEPKIQDFRIEFERPGATYASGETVTGDVILNLSGPLKNIREISLEVRGDAEVHWTEVFQNSNGDDTDIKHFYRGSEHYFSLSNRLFGNGSEEEPTTLPAGQHSFHFSFTLRTQIPCSIEHEFGHVRYTVKAIIDKGRRVDRKVISAITVLTDYDLSAHNKLTTGINDNIERTFKSWSCLGSAGTMKAQVKSRAYGFVPGETIELIIKYDMNSTSVHLKNIKLSLYKFLDFHALSPSRCKKQDSALIKTVERDGPFRKKGATWIDIEVPSLPPSKLEYCSIIDVRYKLVLLLQLSGQHHDEERTYPIEIGTRPVRYRTEPNPTQNAISQPTPSAPPIEEVNASSWKEQQQATLPIGLDVMSAPHYMPGTSQPMPEAPPPSYEECVYGSSYIADEDEEGIVGPILRFRPKYPVYTFPKPPPYDKGMCKGNQSSYNDYVYYDNEWAREKYETDYDNKYESDCGNNKYEVQDDNNCTNEQEVQHDNNYDNNCDSNYGNSCDTGDNNCDTGDTSCDCTAD